MSGWIKLQRKMIDWEWFTDVNTSHLFTYLLLAANYQTTKWRGHIILPGQLMTGRTLLATATGLSEQNIRTSLEKLKSTSDITSESFNKYSIITITNWEKYQVDNQQTNQQVTSESTNNQPANQPTTNHIQESKEDKKEKRESNPPSQKTKLSLDWWIPESWGDWSMKEFGWDVQKVIKVADKFKINYLASGAEKDDWEATWKLWCFNEK